MSCKMFSLTQLCVDYIRNHLLLSKKLNNNSDCLSVFLQEFAKQDPARLAASWNRNMTQFLLKKEIQPCDLRVVVVALATILSPTEHKNIVISLFYRSLAAQDENKAFMLMDLYDLQEQASKFLRAACINGCSLVALKLIEYGAAVDAQDEYGKQTVLHIAVERGLPLVIQKLIELNSDCNARDDHGMTPLHSLFGGKCWEATNLFSPLDVDTVRLLIDKTDYQIHDSSGYSTLESAYRIVRQGQDRQLQNPHLIPLIEILLSPYGYIPPTAELQKTFNLYDAYSESFILESLQKTADPSGYAPLNTHTFPAFGSTLFEKSLFQDAKLLEKMDLFAASDVILIEDGKSCGLKELSREEATAYQVLFKKICQNQTTLQVHGARIMDAIKKLFYRPAGRMLLLALIRSNQPILILENKMQNGITYCPPAPHLPHLVAVDFSTPISCLCYDQEQNLVTEREEGFLFVAHELLHAHFNSYSIDLSYKLLENSPLDLSYDNLNEQLIITGIEGENLISENMLRYEFGYLRRYGHRDEVMPAG